MSHQLKLAEDYVYGIKLALAEQNLVVDVRPAGPDVSIDADNVLREAFLAGWDQGRKRPSSPPEGTRPETLLRVRASRDEGKHRENPHRRPRA